MRVDISFPPSSCFQRFWDEMKASRFPVFNCAEIVLIILQKGIPSRAIQLNFLIHNSIFKPECFPRRQRVNLWLWWTPWICSFGGFLTPNSLWMKQDCLVASSASNKNIQLFPHILPASRYGPLSHFFLRLHFLRPLQTVNLLSRRPCWITLDHLNIII